jgi:hypothetical protein
MRIFSENNIWVDRPMEGRKDGDGDRDGSSYHSHYRVSSVSWCYVWFTRPRNLSVAGRVGLGAVKTAQHWFSSIAYIIFIPWRGLDTCSELIPVQKPTHKFVKPAPPWRSSSRVLSLVLPLVWPLNLAVGHVVANGSPTRAKMGRWV